MSVAIKNALMNLNLSIDKIETSLEKHRKKLNNAQPDLFSAPVKTAVQASAQISSRAQDQNNQDSGAGDTGTVVHFDRSALARKLDMTIARVEELLGEA